MWQWECAQLSAGMEKKNDVLRDLDSIADAKNVNALPSFSTQIASTTLPLLYPLGPLCWEAYTLRLKHLWGWMIRAKSIHGREPSSDSVCWQSHPPQLPWHNQMCQMLCSSKCHRQTAVASAASVLEMQNLRPCSYWLKQNPHFNKIPGVHSHMEVWEALAQYTGQPRVL